ncbi:hypothetical protein F5B21DRAFT_474446 [Xylaria acuta]|nr:hypothetical protein F5B21DRAFT_474446 [Xylaria acuta]
MGLVPARPLPGSQRGQTSPVQHWPQKTPGTSQGTPVRRRLAPRIPQCWPLMDALCKQTGVLPALDRAADASRHAVLRHGNHDLRTPGVGTHRVRADRDQQVDGAIANLDALEKIVDAIGDTTYVMYDSGIRGGADIFTALALDSMPKGALLSIFPENSLIGFCGEIVLLLCMLFEVRIAPQMSL